LLFPVHDDDDEENCLNHDVFCHLDGPQDYFEYTGLAAALAKRGWATSSVLAKGLLPHMQWCPHNKTAWPLVLRSNLVTVSVILFACVTECRTKRVNVCCSTTVSRFLQEKKILIIF
jgi:hypothetical protein